MPKCPNKLTKILTITSPKNCSQIKLKALKLAAHMHCVTFSSIFGPLSLKANLGSRINLKQVLKNFGMELYTVHRDWMVQSYFIQFSVAKSHILKSILWNKETLPCVRHRIICRGLSVPDDDTNIVDFDILENCLKEEKNGFSLLCWTKLESMRPAKLEAKTNQFV